ncbi:hypothetical protein [Actinoplanes xinjiangensis]|uniref:Uncharacterized protein n=1 Tax=Actinoplanes xinjiangensis TaxID=512350 RepID=A0A316ETB6_9ACTN|nr:hypothetical protein [Actinoplanes xinjiangensis]PWK35848.1 hypothetical protein BC793_12549 [Actinoplanes xinjiangensis]GIF43031.1 hypothetical protein Axi01nite_73420 [Actinoplanes xinjiangensis]
MPRKTNTTEHLDVLERRLQEALDLVRDAKRAEQTATRWMGTSAEIGTCLAAGRDALSGVRQEILGGARTAVLAYLRQRVGQPVTPGALEGVSGIEEWTRRVRELRGLGWEIEALGSGPARSYRLRADRLDESVVDDDTLIAKITGGRPKDRLIEYLFNVAPWPVAAVRLERVARTATWQRDLQELIDEGWLIQTHEDDADIPPGFYRLARLED